MRVGPDASSQKTHLLARQELRQQGTVLRAEAGRLLLQAHRLLVQLLLGAAQLCSTPEGTAAAAAAADVAVAALVLIRQHTCSQLASLSECYGKCYKQVNKAPIGVPARAC